MKLEVNDLHLESHLPESRISFQVDHNPMLFEMLSSKIYKDKILTVIRELSCNANDSHIEAGKRDVPFLVQLPNRIEPTFAVQDFGVGINPDKIQAIFWTYGKSTKTLSNDQTGALGLGSKSPFAYAKGSYIVKNRYSGKEYTYLCFIDENHMPSGSLVDEKETTECNGVRIEMAVKVEDVEAFRLRARRFFTYWEGTKPDIVGVDRDLIYCGTDLSKILEGNGWFLEENRQRSDFTGAIAIMGNVQYPIETDSIPNLPHDLRLIATKNFVVTFKMATLAFAISRESLEYTEHTNKSIIKRLAEVKEEITDAFHNIVYVQSKTNVDFIKAFRSKVQLLTRALGVDTKTVLGLVTDGQIGTTFNGYTYTYEDLVNGKFEVSTDGHSSFCVYGMTEKASRSFKHSGNRPLGIIKKTMLNFIANQDIEAEVQTADQFVSVVEHADEIDEETNAPIATLVKKFSFKAGDSEEHQWVSSKFNTRKKKELLSEVEQLMIKKGMFDVSTNHIMVISEGTAPLRFIINDCASAGRARVTRAETGARNVFYVEFDRALHTAEAVAQDVKTTFEKIFNGMTVEMLSKLPDNRVITNSNKIPKGSIKLKAYQIRLHEDKKKRFQTVRTSVYKDLEKEVYFLDDLKQSPFLYVYARGSRDCRDTPKASWTSSTLDKIDEIIAAGLLDDFITSYTNIIKHGNTAKPSKSERIKLFVLTENQEKYLIKNNVQMTLLRPFVDAQIAKLKQEIDFIGKKREHIANSTSEILEHLEYQVDNQVFSGLPDDHQLKKLYKKWKKAQRDDSLDDETEICLAVYDSLVHDTYAIGIKSSVDELIHRNYPLLAHVQLSSVSKKIAAAYIADYVSMADRTAQFRNQAKTVV